MKKRKNDWGWPWGLALLGLILVTLTGCRSAPDPFQQFRRVVEAALTEVEAQNLNGLAALLHDSFRDQQDRDRDEMTAWLNSLMNRRKDVVVNILDMDEVTAPGPGTEGEVALDVVVSSGGLKMVRKLVGFYGRLVRITLYLVDGEPWLISAAEWREVDLADLSVAAIEEFKRIFPGASGK
jgi:hypothetical protein